MMSAKPAQRVEWIPIERIHVLNPRLRNKKVFKEIVENIAKIGLKRPITVTRRLEAGGPFYDLVCGQGRLEAYQELGQQEVPALVVSADAEDCMIASLVENCARRQHKAIDLLQDIEHRNRSEALYRGKGLVPSGGQPSPAYSPLLAYRWEETDAALAALLDERGGPMASVEFVKPTPGAPALPTMACEMHRLAPGDRSPTRRKVGSSVFVAYRGAGTTVINGERFDWEAGDMFVTPSWAAVDHQCSEPSDLFSISDAPILKALGLYREQESDEPQAIERVFEDRPRR
jgi:hypothetical protein